MCHWIWRLDPKYLPSSIYNDANGQNIILQRVSSNEYKVVEMIDFHETVYSSYIFDLSTSLFTSWWKTFLQLEPWSSWVYSATGQWLHLSISTVFRGEAKCVLPDISSMLSVCCIRWIKFKAEPWNEYMLTTPRKGWKLIDLLLSAGKWLCWYCVVLLSLVC